MAKIAEHTSTAEQRELVARHGDMVKRAGLADVAEPNDVDDVIAAHALVVVALASRP